MRLPVFKFVTCVTLAVVISSCRSPTGANDSTGLTGTVRRGPITPVCQSGVACDAPFAASFTVHQGGRSVAEFQSDATGTFAVRLTPGDYTVVPGPDAPIISPATQVRAVTVGPAGLTVVRLSFDTGIR